MIRIFYLGLLIFSCVNTFAQSSADTTLATYIKTKHYTKITDTVHFSRSITPYYPAIMDYMTGDKLYMRDFYIPIAGVRDESYTLTISLCDLKTIRIKKAYDDNVARDTQILNDGIRRVVVVKQQKNLPGKNPSGRDGYLVINKLSGKVTFNIDKE